MYCRDTWFGLGCSGFKCTTEWNGLDGMGRLNEVEWHVELNAIDWNGMDWNGTVWTNEWNGLGEFPDR